MDHLDSVINEDDDEINKESEATSIIEPEKETEVAVSETTKGINNAVIFGDSNLRDFEMNGENVTVIQKSGASFGDIEDLLNKTPECINKEEIENIVLHLGTNDLLHSKGDEDITEMNMMDGTKKVIETFENAQVWISSVLPRKGKGEKVKNYNEKVKVINCFLKKLSKRHECTEFIDNYEIFAPNNLAKKALFQDTDNAGLHINEKGKEVLQVSFCETINRDLKDRKRGRDENMSTPPSAEKKDNKNARIENK